MTEPSWTLVVVEQNLEFQNTIDTIWSSLLVIMLALLVIGIALSLFSSYRVYQPWNKLYQKVIGDAASSGLYDDVSTIYNSIHLTQNQLDEYLRYKNSTEHILLETYLRALLREDTQTIEKMPDADLSAFNEALSRTSSVAIFRINHWKKVKRGLSGTSDACSYTLRQLSVSCFAHDEAAAEHENQPNETWIYLGGGNFLLLALSDFSYTPEEEAAKWISAIKEIQRLFYEQTGLPVTVALGGHAQSPNACIDACHTATELLNYSALFEMQSIIDSSAIEQLTSGSPAAAYDEAQKKALRDAMCSNREQDAQQILEGLLLEYRTGGLQTFLLYLTRLFLHLDQAAENICKTRGVKLPNAPQPFYHLLSDAEALDDIRSGFASVMSEICAHDYTPSARSNDVVEAVKEYIKGHYKEDIALKSLAAKYNFSPGYLGMLFKNEVGLSVLEYTNEVQLEAAEQLIKNTNLHICDIMQECGFINESNFYRLFKNKYGVTPKSYRVRAKQ